MVKKFSMQTIVKSDHVGLGVHLSIQHATINPAANQSRSGPTKIKFPPRHSSAYQNYVTELENTLQQKMEHFTNPMNNLKDIDQRTNDLLDLMKNVGRKIFPKEKIENIPSPQFVPRKVKKWKQKLRHLTKCLERGPSSTIQKIIMDLQQKINNYYSSLSYKNVENYYKSLKNAEITNGKKFFQSVQSK